MKKYEVKGMTCATCASRVEKAAGSVRGVTQCSVNLLLNTLSAEGDYREEALASAISRAGYTLVTGQDVPEGKEERNGFPRILAVSAVLLIVLMYIGMGHSMAGFPLPAFLDGNPAGQGITQLLLSGVILFMNRRFFINGWKGARHLSPNMDTLVALGSGISFVYSTVLLYGITLGKGTIHGLYYESSAMILVLISIGKLLEERAKGRTTSAIRALEKLAPQEAHLIREGRETDIPAKDLRPGDLFAVRPGESFPADGEVTEGTSAADESMLTGESLPRDKEKGSTVAQATVNLTGYLVCRVTKNGSDTVLSRIIASVSDAAASKAPIARLADRVAAVFVPAVLGIALTAFAVHMLLGHTLAVSLSHAITVLVISCPCSLGLATPVAIMTGTGRAAQKGVLFRTASSLEAAGRIQTVCFDKTGTVTTGKMTVTDLLPVNGTNETELADILFTLEGPSEHPIARAITEYALSRGGKQLPVRDFTALPGSGVRAVIGDMRYTAMSPSRVEQAPQDAQNAASQLSREGKTPVFICRGEKVIAIAAVADRIRDDAREAVSRLHRMGIRTVMLTGDDPVTAQSIAREAGIDEVYASLLPLDKAERVRSLAQAGPTAMVGDGINDAPALACATLGIAVGKGTDAAIGASDAVLLREDACAVSDALSLGRRVLINIRENLFWAFLYNALCIPLAAGLVPSVTLSPMLGAAAMSLSSFCVVMNALRLKAADPARVPRARKRPITIPEQTIKERTIMTKTLTVQGMMCTHCEARVKKCLEAIDGVVSADVSHVTGKAVVTLEKDVADDVLRAVVEAQDYPVTSIE